MLDARSVWQKFVPGAEKTSAGSTTSSWDSANADDTQHHDLKAAGVDVEHSPDAEKPDTSAQDGVTAAEAITLTWTKTSLGAVYIL